MFKWPEGKVAALVMGIDDVFPGPSFGSSGNADKGSLDYVSHLLTKYPSLGVTLFVTPDYIYKRQRGARYFVGNKFLREKGIIGDVLSKLVFDAWPPGTFRLDQPVHKLWCSFVQDLASSGRVSLAIHGLTHMQRYFHPKFEFKNLTEEECRLRLRKAKEIFAQAKLPHDLGFLPPGYGVYDSLVQAIKDEGFHYIAGNVDTSSAVSLSAISDGDHSTNRRGLKSVPVFSPCVVDGSLVNVPRNWDLGSNSIERALEIAASGGLISIYAHAEHESLGWRFRNGVNARNLEKLSGLIKALETAFPDKIWYATFADVADWTRAEASRS